MSLLTDFDSGWLEVWGLLRRVEQTSVGQGFRRVGGDPEKRHPQPPASGLQLRVLRPAGSWRQRRNQEQGSPPTNPYAPWVEAQGIEATLDRVAAGSRIIAAAWMGILGAFAAVSTSTERPIYVWATIGLALIWAATTATVYGRDRSLALAKRMLTFDVSVAVLSVLAALASGADSTFYGAFALIVVAIAALRDRVSAAVTALALLVVVLATLQNLDLEGITSQLTLIFAYVGLAVLVSWIVQVLRESEARLVEANRQTVLARAEAAREVERLDISRHLHDSVLQTLALIQRESEDAGQVRFQARRQERELRDWLFESGSVDDFGFERQLLDAAAMAEERFGVPVDVVSVGSVSPSNAVNRLIAAASEAIANAAQHSGASTVSVYGEVDDLEVFVFVRDRGSGFDPDAIPSDRHGVTDSIIGRMRDVGGAATVKTGPGKGTEWDLRMPLERSEDVG